jgi:hypothetical protein
MSLESAITYEEVSSIDRRPFNPDILSSCATSPPNEHIYTKIEGTGEAFGGAARRIIRRPRMLKVVNVRWRRRRARLGGLGEGRRSILYFRTRPHTAVADGSGV